MSELKVSDQQYAQPRLDHVTCVSPFGTHRMAYWEWGDPIRHTVRTKWADAPYGVLGVGRPK